jgi:hypothetical protein
LYRNLRRRSNLAFGGCEEVEEAPSDDGPKTAGGSLGGLSQERLELGDGRWRRSRRPRWIRGCTAWRRKQGLQSAKLEPGIRIRRWSQQIAASADCCGPPTTHRLGEAKSWGRDVRTDTDQGTFVLSLQLAWTCTSAMKRKLCRAPQWQRLEQLLTELRR